MPEIKISEENFRKAHAEGCSDVRKVLETLAPDLFKIKYPCYGKFTATGMVVYFTAPSTGVVVVQGETFYDVGKHSSSWMTEWTPVEIGTIEGVK